MEYARVSDQDVEGEGLLAGGPESDFGEEDLRETYVRNKNWPVCKVHIPSLHSPPTPRLYKPPNPLKIGSTRTSFDRIARGDYRPCCKGASPLSFALSLSLALCLVVKQTL
jgi:hypothetical protein